MEYTFKRSRKSYRATVYNFSDTGLYVESDRELKPGQDIRIHIRPDADKIIPAPYDDHPAIIRWALPMSSGRHHMYGAGVMLYYPGVNKGLGGLPDIQYFCDMCGEEITSGQVVKEGLVWLCPHCSEYIRHLPVGVSRVTSRYLIGNVI